MGAEIPWGAEIDVLAVLMIDPVYEALTKPPLTRIHNGRVKPSCARRAASSRRFCLPDQAVPMAQLTSVPLSQPSHRKSSWRPSAISLRA